MIINVQFGLGLWYLTPLSTIFHVAEVEEILYWLRCTRNVHKKSKTWKITLLIFH